MPQAEPRHDYNLRWMALYSPVVPIFSSVVPICGGCVIALFRRTKWNKNEHLALFVACHTRAPWLPLICSFFCLRKWKNQLISRQEIQPLTLICVQVIEWVCSPAELTSRHRLCCLILPRSLLSEWLLRCKQKLAGDKNTVSVFWR